MINKTLKNYVNNEAILNIYLHGSRVYGTNSPHSDYDYIIVIEDAEYFGDNLSDGECDFNFFSKSEWIEMCQENHLDFCESYYLPEKFKIKETFRPDFQINKEKLRASFSKCASNSFVKCKKKLTVEKDFAPYVGKKSLWHSFRILMFGTQILLEGEISDYGCANYLYKEIVECPSDDWAYFKEKYQQLYKKYKSEFRASEKLSLDN